MNEQWEIDVYHMRCTNKVQLDIIKLRACLFRHKEFVMERLQSDIATHYKRRCQIREEEELDYQNDFDDSHDR